MPRPSRPGQKLRTSLRLKDMTEGREELHQLIDALPEEQVGQVLADVRRRTSPRAAPGDKAFAWIGAGGANNGRSDNASRVDELLAEGFGRG